MHRYIFLLTALLAVATVAQAKEPQNHRGTVRGTVFAYECKQVNAMALGFTCEFKNGDLMFVRHERFDSMTPERHELADYEFSKISIRYMELGGKQYMQRADFWPSNKRRVCYRVDNLPYKIACDDIKLND